MEWRGPVARPRAVLQTVCLPRAVVNSSSLGRTLGGVVLKEVGNALGRLYGASHPLAVAGGQIANPKYGGTTDGVARKTICFGSLVFWVCALGFGCGCLCLCRCCCGRQECGVCVECVCGECVAAGARSSFRFRLVWSGHTSPTSAFCWSWPAVTQLVLVTFLAPPVQATTGADQVPRYQQGGGWEGGALLGSGHTNLPTHDTQHTAHSTQLTAHSARAHTHTGTQGHTVGTLGGLALSSASTHSSGPPNDAHHGRSALHQRRQAASRSSPWWTPPPSG